MKKKLPIVILILLVLGIACMGISYSVTTYETDSIDTAYMKWCTGLDITSDGEYIAFIDYNSMLYIIDAKDSSLRYMAEAYELGEETPSLESLCFDENDNLYVYITDAEYDKIIELDTEGNVLCDTVIEAESQWLDGITRTGFGVEGDKAYFVVDTDEDYYIESVDLSSGAASELVSFEKESYQTIQNAKYGNGAYAVTFFDGTVVRAYPDGTSEFIYRFNFSLDDEDSIYPYDFMEASDRAYFSDNRYFSDVYSFKDGNIEKVISLEDLYDWSDLNEIQIAESTVDYAIAYSYVKDDKVLIASSGNVFIIDNDEISSYYFTEEGARLPDDVIRLNYLKYGLKYAGYILLGLFVVTLLIFIIGYNFTVLNKILMLILPVVAIAFFIIFKLIVGRLEAVYTEGVTKELVTKSSLIAASIDVSLLEEINDLDDIANGNFDELRESLMRLIEADADWTDDICMELYTAKRNPYNYLIISEAFSDEFLGSYLFQTEKGLSVNRYGDTNVYVTQTTSEAYGYVDAFTLIYNDEDKLIGILDVYVYADKVAEQVEEVREKVTLIAAIVLLIIMSLLIGVAKYITSTLEKTSRVVKSISEGNLKSRVEKIPNDELGIVAKGINDMANQLEELFESQDEFTKQAIETLVGTIDAKDKYTNGHSIRVAQYSSEIARRLGKSEEEQERIYYAGLLHDIGKIAVPDAIINKTSRLDDKEFDIIKTHPEKGYELLNNLSQIKDIAVGAYGHHERIDGRGYPQGIKGEEIPEMARIIGVADAYDAMTSNRSYRNALPQAKVRSEIENGKGIQFDPVFADIMLDIDTERSAEYSTEA